MLYLLGFPWKSPGLGLRSIVRCVSERACNCACFSSRESEIVELKSQLTRMREDWIEEECHRVEAQLALKEARKEIKQLKQVIDSMRSSLSLCASICPSVRWWYAR